MTDLERRLRAAMAASAEPAPAGLLEGIHRRHRRHHRRLAAACAAVLAFGVAGTLVSRGVMDGLAGAGPSGGGPAATGPAVQPSATPAAGTVFRDCQSNNFGTLSPDWKASSVHAGPVWFIYARPRSPTSSGHLRSTGKVAGSAMIVAVDNGRTAVVSAAPQIRGRFRFLTGFNPDGKPYTLAEGAPGLTLAGCPPVPAGTRMPEAYAPGVTMFWQGYVTGLRGCIPLEVRTRSARTPIRVSVAAPTPGAAHDC